jgi:hypothetical protein
MSVDHEPAQTPAERPTRRKAVGRGHNGAPGPHPCPECMQPFPPAHPHQLFCSLAHRSAWNERAKKRGRQVFPLMMVARITRDGSRGDKELGKRAASEFRELLRRWKDEDVAAGRMTWPRYLARLRAIGVDPLT